MKNNKIIKYLPWVFISAILQSIGLTSFSVPGKIYSSGVTGFSRLLSDILFDFFNINVKYTVFYIIINICLAIIVFNYIRNYLLFYL